MCHRLLAWRQGVVGDVDAVVVDSGEGVRRGEVRRPLLSKG